MSDPQRKLRSNSSGGRPGQSGYRYQNGVTAVYLAQLLNGTSALAEVMWEKSSLQMVDDGPVLPVTVDDIILKYHDGRWVFISVKENTRRASWTIARLLEREVFQDFWQQWQDVDAVLYPRIQLRFISASDVASLKRVIECVKTARNWKEAEASASSATRSDLQAIRKHLKMAEPMGLLAFLRSVQAEQWRDPAQELRAELARLSTDSIPLEPYLVDIIAKSTHPDHRSNALHTCWTLLEQLEIDGAPVAAVTALRNIGSATLRTDALATAKAQVTVHWNNSIESRIYVPRGASETYLLDEIRRGTPWVSLEGEAGSGKSTLLHKVHAQLLEEAAAQSDFVPLLVDTIWLLNDGNLNETPLAPLSHLWCRHTVNGWDALSGLGRVFAAAGLRLILLVDTVDAALLTRTRDRVVQWLEAEAADAQLQIISCCRPLESHAHFSPYRHRVELGEFTIPEARRAIEAYVSNFYGAMTAAQRAETMRTLQGYLNNPQFEDVCRHPVTLRMLFEAHCNHPPTEAINRYQLFRVYWQRKVRGDGCSLRRRSRPRATDTFVRRAALMMMDVGSIRLGTRQVELLQDRSLDGEAARDDLVSEGVIEEESGWYSFFHQSFLEYALARAILELSPEDLESRLQKALAPLAGDTATPMFALVEELALQAPDYPGNQVLTGRILTALLESRAAGAVGSAARVYCQTHLTDTELGFDAHLLEDAVFLRVCLETLHNALPLRMRQLLQVLIPRAWRDGDIALRLQALKTLARVAPVLPDATQTELTHLDIENAILSMSPADSGPFVDNLGRIYAALLGADDEFAAAKLDSLYCRLIYLTPDTSHRANLVEEVGARVDVANRGKMLLYKWIVTPETPRSRKFAILREAFGKSLGSYAPSDEDLAGEREWIVGPHATKDSRERMVAVWAARIARGIWRPGEHLWPLFLAAVDANALGLIGAIGIMPLAKSRNAELLECLLEAAVREIQTPTPHDGIRYRAVLLALGNYANDYATRIVEHIGLLRRPIPTLREDEYVLLLQCLLSLPQEEQQRAISKIRGEDVKRRYLSVPTGRMARLPWSLVMDAFQANVSVWNRGQLARQVAMQCDGMTSEQARAALTWLLDNVGHPSSNVRLRILEALPDVFNRVGEDQSARLVLKTLLDGWSNSVTDGDASAVGRCVVKVVRIMQPHTEWIRRVHEKVQVFLTRRTSNWRTARKSAIQVLNVLSRFIPLEVLRDIEDMLLLPSNTGELLTGDDLVPLAGAIYPAAGSCPAEAWRVLKTLSAYAQSAGGCGRLDAAIKGTVQIAFQTPAIRAQILRDLDELPDILVTSVLRFGKNRDDDEVFAAFRSRQLPVELRRMYDLWARRRSIRNRSVLP